MDPNQNQNVHHQCPTELPHYFTDYDDGSNWGYQEMKVYYYVNLHRGQMPVFDGQVSNLYDGEAFFSNLSPTPTPITVFRFFDVNCASPYIARQHIRDSSLNETEASPFLGTHRFSCWTQGFVDVVYNKLPTETIYSWFRSSRPRLLFEFDTSGKLTRPTPTGLRPEVQNTLKYVFQLAPYFPLYNVYGADSANTFFDISHLAYISQKSLSLYFTKMEGIPSAYRLCCF